jgi:hypothetical protein
VGVTHQFILVKFIKCLTANKVFPPDRRPFILFRSTFMSTSNFTSTAFIHAAGQGGLISAGPDLDDLDTGEDSTAAMSRTYAKARSAWRH